MPFDSLQIVKEFSLPCLLVSAVIPLGLISDGVIRCQIRARENMNDFRPGKIPQTDHSDLLTGDDGTALIGYKFTHRRSAVFFP